MQPDANDLSDLVILTVKAALAPALERVAALEARLAMIPAAEKTLTELRDRLVVLETKFDQPRPEPVAPVVDLAPLTDRLAAAEAGVAQLIESEKALGEMRDRLVTCETKLSVASAPHTSPPVDLAPVLDRLSELKDSMAIKSAAPTVDLSPLNDRLAQIEAKSLEKAPNAHVIDLAKDVATLRERMAAVEARQPIPGPQGPKGEDGKDGKDGINGKDGVDGLGFDDLSVDFDNDRTVLMKFERGSKQKIFPLRFPFMRHEGVYAEGKSYDAGDVVTWGGSLWHCQTKTLAKPGDSKDWVLIVRRGRDGRDGKDAATLPVVTLPKAGSNV